MVTAAALFPGRPPARAGRRRPARPAGTQAGPPDRVRVQQATARPQDAAPRVEPPPREREEAPVFLRGGPAALAEGFPVRLAAHLFPGLRAEVAMGRARESYERCHGSARDTLATPGGCSSGAARGESYWSEPGASATGYRPTRR